MKILDSVRWGPQERDHLLNLARTKGISLRTLERAKAQLGIISTQRRRQGCYIWYWSLPTA
jgi:predicted kinase